MSLLDGTMKNNGMKRWNESMTDRILRIAAIMYALVLAVIIMYLNRAFYHDDAYITLRYARNCIAGFGLVWNPGEYVQGYTNFLHLIFITLLGWLGIDLVWASRIVGVTAMAGLLGIVILFRITVKNERGAPVWHIPAILVVTSAPILVWSLGGLEGTLFGFLVAGGCLLFLLATDSPKKYWLYTASGIFFGLSFLARPDSIVFISVSLAWLFWLTLKNKSHTFFQFMAYLVGLMIVVVPYVVWQMLYYGDLVPNTFYAKAGTPLWLRLDSGARYMVHYLIHPPFLPILVCISLVYALLKRRWSPKLTYLTLSISAYLTFIILVGGDHMLSFRLLLPVIPLMSAAMAIALYLAIGSNRRVTVSLFTLAILIVTSLQLQDRTLNPRREDPASFVGTIIGKYIAKAWPVGSLVALNTGGSTPYYAGSHRYIDMLGLNDPTIAKRSIEKVEVPWQRIPGHFKGDGGYVLSRHPDYIIIGPAEGTVASQPWFLSDLELSRDPQFFRDYAVFSISLDRNGHEIAGGGLLFTYYQRAGRQEETNAVQQPVAEDGAAHRR